MDVYTILAVVTGLVVLGLLIRYAAKEADLGADLLIGTIVLALVTAPVAGVLWPVTWLVGLIWAVVTPAPDVDPLRLGDRSPVVAAPVESDRQHYERLHREQQALAHRARGNGQEDTAKMHDLLADQHLRLAEIYREANA